MTIDHEKHQLWLVNQQCVRLGIVGQQDADLCTLNGKSLQYRVDSYYEKRDDPVSFEAKRQELRKGLFGNE